MAVDLTEYEVEAPTSGADARRRIDRSTAQALAAALSALAVATLVVSSSSSALVRSGTSVSSDIESGQITLSDDDDGRTLVDLRAMAPGRPVAECIRVDYTGNVLPVDLRLAIDTVGDIAEFVEVEVERGRSGGFGDCESFRPDDIVFDGRLSELDGDGVPVGRILNEGESHAFRFTFDLADEAQAAGRSGTVDFIWEALPT